MTKDQRQMKKIQKDVTDLQNYLNRTYDELEGDVRRLGIKAMYREAKLSMRIDELKDRIDTLVNRQNV